MEKIDLFKLHRSEYRAGAAPALVEVGAARYLAVDGTGAPGGEEFTACVGALYSMAYTVKMTRKAAGLADYVVGKLEALCWCEGEADLGLAPKDSWRWKLMIRTPEDVQGHDLADAAARLASRGNGARVGEVALETLEEGLCAQALHVGPYDREGETVAMMERFADERGYAFAGAHHEIYLSDPRRTAPEALKTILRRPLAKR